MTRVSRLSLFLILPALSLAAQAQVQSPQAPTIHGTYLVHQTRTCLVAPESAPGQSPFVIITGTNGYPQVRSPVVASLSENTVVYEAVIDPTKGTIVSDDVVVTGLDENHAPGTVWTRSHRTSSSTFSVDLASDTLLVTGTTQQGLTPYGATAIWNSAGGGRLRTVDNGNTYEGVASDGPAMTELTVTAPNGAVSWSAIVCDGTTRGELISRSTTRPARR